MLATWLVRGAQELRGLGRPSRAGAPSMPVVVGSCSWGINSLACRCTGRVERLVLVFRVERLVLVVGSWAGGP